MTRNHDREHELKPEAKHEARHEKKQVKSHLAIAMERAAAMAHGAPAGEHAPPPEMRVPEEELKALREKAAKADEYFDRLLRTAADLENYKKRAERERSDLLKFGQEELMGELIVVLDNFGRALDSAGNSAAAKGMADGVSLIRKQLLTVLDKFGLRPVEAVGQKFNPELHEAVAQVETDAQPEGTVVGEQLRGYTLNGRLLRPAVVTVAAPPKSADDGTAAS
ncbi:MAG: nucleotide exchange factor GrpE [Chlamydiota bacterium]